MLRPQVPKNEGQAAIWTRRLALVPVLLACSALWAQGPPPTLVVTGTGGTTHDFTGSFYGDHVSSHCRSNRNLQRKC